MNTLTQVIVGAVAAVTIAIPAGLASASNPLMLIGDTNHDRPGQAMYYDGAACSVVSGDPVVVTVNGRRHLQAIGTVVCKRASIDGLRIRFERLGATSMAPTGAVASSASASPTKSAGPVAGNRASLVLRLPCKNYGLNSYASQFEVDVRTELNRRQALVFDFSRFNGRSCSI